MTTRFFVSPTGNDDRPGFSIIDLIAKRAIAFSEEKSDAEFIAVKLNTDAVSTASRQAMALQMWGFRLQVENDSGEPLSVDPCLAIVLGDLCRYLGFGEGERALVLGPDILAYLNSLDNPETPESQSELIII